jgi:hypothetical protein
MPVSVTALSDGSRFYVASYVTGTATSSSGSTTCPDSNVTAPAGCVIPQVTVFDAKTLAVKTTVFPLLPPVTTAQTTVYPFALAPVTFCAPVFPYTPASARFRMSTVAAPDSSRVYASMCDGGAVAIVRTATNTITTGVNGTDTLVTDVSAPFSGGPPRSNNEPAPQSPVFLLTGQ